jgi:uncharacterized protein YkwD
MTTGMALFTVLRRTLAVVLLALPTAAALLPASPAHAGQAIAAATPAEEEQSFLTMINRERSSRGLGKLVWDSELAPTSRSWSSYMASNGALSHDPNLAAVASRVEPNWRSVGENVGVGYSVTSLHDAFMNSSGHRANILKSGYNRVGIGVVHSGGKIWVTVRFLQGPAISGSTGSAPAPVPGVRTALTGDFNADGFGDLLAYNPGSTADELWFGEADNTMRRGSAVVNGQYRPVAGDFDGDGRAEIIWYAPGSTNDFVWEWDGDSWASTPKTINGTYKALVGDFEGDGRDDVLWYAPGRAGDFYWYGNADGSFSSIGTKINGTYRPLIGDLDGNGGDDLFWYAPGTASDWMWYSTLRRGGYSNQATTVNGTYTPFTGDFDGSGTDDLFWYAPGTGKDFAWYTNKAQGGYTSVARTVTNSYVPGSTDFDGDGADDIVWFSPTSAGGDPVWFGVDGTRGYTVSSVRT